VVSLTLLVFRFFFHSEIDEQFKREREGMSGGKVACIYSHTSRREEEKEPLND